MWIQTSRDVLHPVMMVEPTLHFPIQKLPRSPTELTNPRVEGSVVGLAPVEHPPMPNYLKPLLLTQTEGPLIARYIPYNSKEFTG